MQVMFVWYHYFAAKEWYNWIRIYIAAYVWMTGFGKNSFQIIFVKHNLALFPNFFHLLLNKFFSQYRHPRMRAGSILSVADSKSRDQRENNSIQSSKSHIFITF